MTEIIEIKPQPGPQTAFLSNSADICIYGGAAGGGKTWALLLEMLRHAGNPNFRAVIFRNTYVQVTESGGMWDESDKLYPLLDAESKYSRLTWHFPSGAKVGFSYLEAEKDKWKYQGAQFALIGFDQLEQFSESSFIFMLSRNRSTWSRLKRRSGLPSGKFFIYGPIMMKRADMEHQTSPRPAKPTK